MARPRLTSFLSRSESGRPIELIPNTKTRVHQSGKRLEELRLYISNHDPVPRAVLIYVGTQNDDHVIRINVPAQSVIPVVPGDGFLLIGREVSVRVNLIVGNATAFGSIRGA
jgi:hypothetical protein